MNPAILATLKRLERADWFSRVGVKDTEAAVVLSSWDEAVEHCSSLEWENLCLEMSNRLSEKILQKSKERFVKWNDIAIELKQTTIPFVRRKIESVVQDHHLPKVFEDTVQWDVLALCMETEYADVVPPGFYTGHAYWYTKGHFPCGWQQGTPSGKPIIY